MLFFLLLLGFALLVSFHQGDYKFYDPDRSDGYKTISKEDEQIPLSGGKYQALLLHPPTTCEEVEKGTVLHFHAKSHCVEDYVPYVRWLTEHGYTVAMLEYPGYGVVKGRPSRRALFKAGVDFLQWAKENAEPPFFIIGQSLGASVSLAAYSAVDIQEVCAVVVEGSFCTYRGAGAAHVEKTFGKFFSKVLAWWLLSDKHSAGLSVQELGIAFLGFHAKSDPIVPLEESEKLLENVASWKKNLVTVKGRRHLGPMLRPGNRTRILEFFQKTADVWMY